MSAVGSDSASNGPMGCSIPILPSEAETLALDTKPMPGLEHLAERQRGVPLTKQQGGNDLNSIREEFQPLCDHQALLCINLIWKEWQCQGPGPYNSGMLRTRAVV